MRITDGQSGTYLELRGADDTGLVREGWGSFPVALAIPILLATVIPFPPLQRLLTEEFLQIWIPVIGASFLLELTCLGLTRRLTRIRWDRRSGTFEVTTRSPWGTERTWRSDFRDVTLTAIEGGAWDDHRRTLTLEIQARGEAEVRSARDEGPIGLVSLLLAILLLPFSILKVFGVFRDRREERVVLLDLDYDGGDRPAVQALADEIAAITGETPELRGSVRWEDGRESIAVHSAYATGLSFPGHDPEARVVELRPTASPEYPRMTTVRDHSVSFPGYVQFLGMCIMSLQFAFVLVVASNLISNPLARHILSALAFAYMVRSLGGLFGFFWSRPRVDEHGVHPRPLAGARFSKEQITAIIDSRRGKDDHELTLLTADGSFTLDLVASTPLAERDSLVQELGRRLAVPAFAVRTLDNADTAAENDGSTSSGPIFGDSTIGAQS